MKSQLPKQITQRKKQGFIMPVNHWIHNDLKKDVQARLLSSESFLSQLFTPKQIKNLFKPSLSFIKIPKNYDPPLQESALIDQARNASSQPRKRPQRAQRLAHELLAHLRWGLGQVHRPLRDFVRHLQRAAAPAAFADAGVVVARAQLPQRLRVRGHPEAGSAGSAAYTERRSEARSGAFSRPSG